MNMIASDLSYECLLKRLRERQLQTPPLSRENQDRYPQASVIPVQPRPAYFNAEDLTPEGVCR